LINDNINITILRECVIDNITTDTWMKSNFNYTHLAIRIKNCKKSLMNDTLINNINTLNNMQMFEGTNNVSFANIKFN